MFFVMIAIGCFGSVRALSRLSVQFGSVLGYASNIGAPQVVDQTNSERRSSGLGQLTLNPLLSQAAYAKAQDMFSHQYWAHTSPSGTEPWDFIKSSGYKYRVAGENLARDFMSSSEVTAAWMASPTHKANIMNPKYSEIGVAVVDGILNGTETTLVVQMFGTPASAETTPQVTDQAISIQEVDIGAPETSPVAESAPLATPTPTELPVNSPPVTSNLISLDQVAGDTSSIVPAPSVTSSSPNASPQVLARFLVPAGNLLPTIIFSPLQLLKAFFLAIVMLIGTALAYDFAVVGNKSNVRLVGKNVAHLMLLFAVAFLLVFFRGGMIN